MFSLISNELLMLIVTEITTDAMDSFGNIMRTRRY